MRFWHYFCAPLNRKWTPWNIIRHRGTLSNVITNKFHKISDVFRLVRSKWEKKTNYTPCHATRRGRLPIDGVMRCFHGRARWIFMAKACSSRSKGVLTSTVNSENYITFTIYICPFSLLFTPAHALFLIWILKGIC